MQTLSSRKLGFLNPYPVKESTKMNKFKYLCLHKSHDHNTNDCIYLKDAIKYLINKGKLSENIQDDYQKGGQDNMRWHKIREDSPKKKCSPMEKSPLTRILKLSLEPNERHQHLIEAYQKEKR